MANERKEIFKEMQTKTARYHYKPTRMAKNKKTVKTKL